MKIRLSTLLIAAFIFDGICSVAFAQLGEAVIMVPKPAIDLTPVVQGVIALAGTALTIFGSWVLTRVAQHFNVKIDAGQQEAFDLMLKKTIAFGATNATDLINQHGWGSIIVKNAIVHNAAEAAVAKFPDTLKSVGLDPKSPNFAENLTDALNRAFPEAIMPVAASPVTPPVTVMATPAPMTVAPPA